MSNLSELHEWVLKNRGDQLPQNAVYAGTTSADGRVYVGRFRNTPGKVNLENGEIYNFWVEKHGSRPDGEILITDHICKWVNICRGDKIPENAIYSGKDSSGDKVWVGREINGEPGKINCHDNNSSIPKMQNLWCLGYWSGSKEAEILIIEEDQTLIEEDVSNNYETKEEKEEEIKLLNDKITFLNQQKDNEIPLWIHNKIDKISRVIRTSDLHIEGGKIANKLYKIIKSAFGDIISIADLIDKIDLQLSSSYTEELITSRETIVTKPNENGFKRYIIMIFSKQDITKTQKVFQFFSSNVSCIDFKIDYMLLEPNNKLAEEICDQLINEKTCMMIESFRPRKQII